MATSVSTIGAELDIKGSLSWITTSYLLTTTVIQPITGRIAVSVIYFYTAFHIIERPGRCWRQTPRLSGTMGIHRWQHHRWNKSRPFADDHRASDQWYRWRRIAESDWYNHCSCVYLRRTSFLFHQCVSARINPRKAAGSIHEYFQHRLHLIGFYRAHCWWSPRKRRSMALDVSLLCLSGSVNLTALVDSCSPRHLGLLVSFVSRVEILSSVLT